MSSALQLTEPVKTPWALKILGAAAVLVPIAMMVTNADEKIKGLSTETTVLRSENVAVAGELEQKVEIISELESRIKEDEATRHALEGRIADLETRESRLQEVAILLKEEIIVAEQEAKLLAMNYQRSAKQLSRMANENEEAAYILARENEILKTATRDKDGQVLALLTEVSTLNTELNFVKDERDELNSEILRVTARMRSLEAESTVMAAQNGDSSRVAIP